MRVRIHVGGGYLGSDGAKMAIDSEQQDDETFDKTNMWPATYANSGFEVFSATPFATVDNIKDIVHKNMNHRYRGRK